MFMYTFCIAYGKFESVTQKLQIVFVGMLRIEIEIDSD